MVSNIKKSNFKLSYNKVVAKMNGKQDYDNSSIYLGEFKDKELEMEFFNYEIINALKYIKPILLILGTLYLSFIVPDYFLIKDDNVFKYILINRVGIILLIILLYLRIKKFKNYILLTYWFTAYEMIISLSFLLIFYKYESPDFLIQVLGVITIILSIFLIPNKWIYMIFTSLTVSISFLLFSVYYLKDIEFPQFSAGIVYTSLVIILSGISSYRMNYYKRIQYINSKKLTKMSMTDALTGIYNRAKFDEELVRLVEISRRYNTPLSLVIFDIDDFKIINDSYGHLTGDKVIVDTVKIVMKAMRRTDVFARWGGDEFAIILPNTQRDEAIDMTARLRVRISEYVFDKVEYISCSFGVVLLEEDDDIETFLHRADQRVYLAKDAGKNIVIS